MIKNYLKTAWRNIWKNKVFSAINIVGLAIGIAACIVILLFVAYEKSFDSFNTKNIYKLDEVQKFPGMVSSQKVGLSMFPMGPALKAEFAEVKSFTRVHQVDQYQLTYREKRVYVPQVFFVDSTFFDIFQFALVKGDRNTALLKPHSVVLTQTMAKTLFGNQDAIGKTISHFGGDTATFSVTGIVADPPKNSQLQFDVLCSLQGNTQPWMNNWGGNWLQTYLEFAPGTSRKAFETKMPAFLKKHMNGDGYKYYELFYLPLRDVHASSADIGLDYLNYQKFDKKLTNLFALIAIIVLVIACINFINLSTARSAERAKEVGIRKSIGAFRFQLAAQFLGETVMLAVIALVLALLLAALVLPYINSLSHRELSLPVTSPGICLLILAGTVFIGLLSGIYPAVYLSSFQPVKVLKGSVQVGRNKSFLRNILVVGQFSSAVILMIATVFVLKQLNFMQQKDPGFNRDQVVTVPVTMLKPAQYQVLKQQLLSNSLISGVTASQDNLGSHLDQSGVVYNPPDAPKKQLAVTGLSVDPDYLSLYKIKLAAGKNFTTEKALDAKQYIINEALAHELLKDQPGKPVSSLIGQKFGYDSLGTIRGISKNFNFNSLHYKIETLFIISFLNSGFNTMSVKINGRDVQQALRFIETSFKHVAPGIPYQYQFLDDHFKEVYEVDAQVSRIVGIMAGLVIIISCLGLFGLASYSAEKRIKEIGVRKVLGASVNSITLLLSGNFLRLVLIANVIAWPVALWAINRWLRDFAYRVTLHWWVFAMVGLISVLIALVTISFQSVKAAVANPVKSLRSE